ncbi:hypothetical protein KFL_001010310 [Klebsormidium nitens]|uniref:Uncharacterized protein n=1 Tax=Klebsormidium nitens TaxID=105231 RepID=A0A1Y1I046_KLENI|nr:hypothetical protein KFL_001010310 [Klebsormidium nitens]|eukprot:GAQ82146.1 hypothetical protein KFL_001010310 [Klebsormidium nitens]
MVHSGSYESRIGKPAVRTLRRWYKDLKDRIETAFEKLTVDRVRMMNFKTRKEDILWREAIFKETMEDTDGGELEVKNGKSYTWPTESFNKSFSQIVEHFKELRLHPERYAEQQSKKATKYKATRIQAQGGKAAEGVSPSYAGGQAQAPGESGNGAQHAKAQEVRRKGGDRPQPNKRCETVPTPGNEANRQGLQGTSEAAEEQPARSRCVISSCTVTTGRPAHMCHVCEKPVHNLCMQKMMLDRFGVENYDGADFLCETHAAEKSGFKQVERSGGTSFIVTPPKSSSPEPVWEVLPAATSTGQDKPSSSSVPQNTVQQQGAAVDGKEKGEQDGKTDQQARGDNQTGGNVTNEKRKRDARAEGSGSGNGKGTGSGEEPPKKAKSTGSNLQKGKKRIEPRKEESGEDATQGPGAGEEERGAGSVPQTIDPQQIEGKDQERNGTEPTEETGTGRTETAGDEVSARPKRNAVRQRKFHEPGLCKAVGCECEFGQAGKAGEAACETAKGKSAAKASGKRNNIAKAEKKKRKRKGGENEEESEEEMDLDGDVIESSDPGSDEEPISDLPIGGAFEDKHEKIDKHMQAKYEVIAMKFLRVKFAYQVTRKEAIKAINGLKLENISKSPELETFDTPYLLKLLSEGAIDDERVYIANKKWREDGVKLTPNEVFVS